MNSARSSAPILQRRVRAARLHELRQPHAHGMDHWTTDDGFGGNRADIASMPSMVGVVVGLSFRPKCRARTCFDIDPPRPHIDQLCNQGTSALVQCYYRTGSATQTFQSGLQFIRAWNSNADNEPDLLSVWLDAATGTNCTNGGYFSAPVANDAGRRSMPMSTRVSAGAATPRSATSRLREHVVAAGRRSRELQQQLRRELRARRRCQWNDRQSSSTRRTHATPSPSRFTATTSRRQ